jgi:hypothetical protein
MAGKPHRGPVWPYAATTVILERAWDVASRIGLTLPVEVAPLSNP